MAHSFTKEQDTQDPRLPPGSLLVSSALPVPSVFLLSSFPPKLLVMGDLAQTWCHLVRV